MRKFVQCCIGLITGAFCGALLGATLLGINAYLDTSSCWLGSGRSWSGVAAIIGAVFGSIPGAVIGLITGATRSDKVYGAMIGFTVASLNAIYLLVAITGFHQEAVFVGVLSIPIGALVGLIVAVIVALF